MIALPLTRYLIYVFKNLNIDEAVREALNQHPNQIESLLKDQLQDGISSTGQPISPDYTDYTQQLKAEKGQPYDRVTLYDTGDLYRSIFLETFESAFDLDALDWKKEKLKEKYEPQSGSIFGLTKEHIKEVAKIIKPTLEKLLTEQIRRLRQNASKQTIAA